MLLPSNSKNTNISVGNIVTVDPFQGTAYGFSGNTLQKRNLSSLGKTDSFIVTYVKHKDIQVASVEFDKHLESDELDTAVYQRVYSDLSLDSNYDYSVKYKAQERDNCYTAFVLNAQILEESSQSIVNKTQYIDYVAVAPMLFSALYSNSCLSSSGVDCFIYFQDDDAFLAIYKDGNYLQSRSLGRYTLSYIKDKVDELSSTRTNKSDFYGNLCTVGIKNDSKEEITQVLDDVFYYVSDILTNITKLSGIQIQKIYVSSEFGKIPGLSKFIENRILIPTSDFDFNVKVNQKETDKSWLHILMYLSARSYLFSGKNKELNFTSYVRPPKFLNRDGGKLITTAIIALLIALAMPCYWLVSSLIYDWRTDLVNKDIEEKTAQITALKSELQRVKGELENIQKEVAAQETSLNTKTTALKDSYDKKTKYAMKGGVLYDLSNFIREVNVKVQNIGISDRTIIVSLISSDDKPITQLIKNIDNSDKYNVSTKQIALRSGHFESNITMEVIK